MFLMGEGASFGSGDGEVIFRTSIWLGKLFLIYGILEMKGIESLDCSKGAARKLYYVGILFRLAII